MTVVLIPSAPIPQRLADGSTEHGTHIPLGLLSLGTIMSDAGVNVVIQSLDTMGSIGVSAQNAAQEIADVKPEWIGLSTMCSTYPLSLAIAQECKRINPSVPVVLGGPQASVVARPTLSAFPFVDFVMVGECDDVIMDLHAALGGRLACADVAGLAYRTGGAIRQNPMATALVQLDSLPLPRYDLVPAVGDLETVPIEAGRGCPFACTFCSTNTFWRRRYRVRRPEGLVRVIRHAMAVTGAHNFRFEHDNLTVDKRQVAGLCHAIIDARLDIEWTCSARTDCLDQPLLDLMYRAGCRAIYVGVETGSEDMQRAIKKRLRLSDAPDRLREIVNSGMRVTTSFILGFPEETEADVLATFDMMDLVREIGKGSEVVQLHLLAPTPATPLLTNNSDRLRLGKFASDFTAYPLDQLAEQWVYDYPEIFASFYYIESRHLPRDWILRTHRYQSVLHGAFPNTARLIRHLYMTERLARPVTALGGLMLEAGDKDERSASNVGAVFAFLSKLLRLEGATRTYEVLALERAICDVRAGAVESALVSTSWDAWSWIEGNGPAEEALSWPSVACVYVVTSTDTGPVVVELPKASGSTLQRLFPQPATALGAGS